MTYLVLRFSAIGDVAMTVPIMASVSRRYAEHAFVVVSHKMLAPLFAEMPNVTFVSLDSEDKYEGRKGLYRLYCDLRAEYAIDAVIDLHDVLRTKLLRTFFRLAGKKVAVLDKGRAEKKCLVCKGAQRYRALKPMFERYVDTFAQLGLQADEEFVSLRFAESDIRQIVDTFGAKTERWIGIAPFAKHVSKMLPFATTKALITHYAERKDVRVFLFGAGIIESEMLEQWADTLGNVTNVAGRLGLYKELALMTQLDVMVCMDSANQHLASLVALPAVSIWGGTHPHTGFYGWKQDPAHAVQRDMPCRPCSVFGTKRCRLGDFPCLRNIALEQIIEKVDRIIGNSDK